MFEPSALQARRAGSKPEEEEDPCKAGSLLGMIGREEILHYVRVRAELGV